MSVVRSQPCEAVVAGGRTTDNAKRTTGILPPVPTLCSSLHSRVGGRWEGGPRLAEPVAPHGAARELRSLALEKGTENAMHDREILLMAAFKLEEAARRIAHLARECDCVHASERLDLLAADLLEQQQRLQPGLDPVAARRPGQPVAIGLARADQPKRRAIG